MLTPEMVDAEKNLRKLDYYLAECRGWTDLVFTEMHYDESICKGVPAGCRYKREVPRWSSDAKANYDLLKQLDSEGESIRWTFMDEMMEHVFGEDRDIVLPTQDVYWRVLLTTPEQRVRALLHAYLTLAQEK